MRLPLPPPSTSTLPSRASSFSSVTLPALPSPPRLLSLAQTLPSHILIDIFTELVRLSNDDGTPIEEQPDPEHAHGGVLVGWSSNCTTVLRARGVCRAWEDAAVFVQYRRITILGETTANLFLRSVRESPDLALATKVRSLVVGMHPNDERGSPDGSSDEAHLSGASSTVITVINTCSNLSQLHVRPLPASCRPSLLEAVRRQTSLASFVCTPMYAKPTPPWSRGLLRTEDLLALALPPLQELELAFEPEDDQDDDLASVTLPPLNLKRFRLRGDIDEEYISQVVIAAGSNLEVLDLYQEYNFELLRTFLPPSYPSMKRLCLITNPTLDAEPGISHSALDSLIPHFEVLESLTVTADLVSSACFRYLPHTLRHITVKSLSPERQFGPSASLLGTLLDPEVNMPLESFSVWDDDDTWSAEHLEAMNRACAARGIVFTFHQDNL